MDLASAVQSLLAYEASLKLAPGQKPPPPSPSLFSQLSFAVAAIARVKSQEIRSHVLSLHPSVWSDWPLCCGVDLTSKELKAARSLPPDVLRSRGLLSLFLALRSCAVGEVDKAACVAANTILAMASLRTFNVNDLGTFPSAHLATRICHRLINADDTLPLEAYAQGDNYWAAWKIFIYEPIQILSVIFRPGTELKRTVPALPHEAAGVSFAKEMAVMLDALSAVFKRDGCPSGRDMPGRLPLVLALNLLLHLEKVLHTAKAQFATLLQDVYREAAALPSYDPVLLLESFVRNIVSGPYPEDWTSISWPKFLSSCRSLLWLAVYCCGSLGKLRPADSYTGMRLGLEERGHQTPSDKSWFLDFLCFANHVLYSGLVQPELILRARPQLLEGLVEGLARGPIPAASGERQMISFLILLTRSPAISFHLRKFLSRSGCLQAVREMSDANDRMFLLRLLGPRAVQSETRPLTDVPHLLKLVADGRNEIQNTEKKLDPYRPTLICDFITRDLTLDMIREPFHAQPIPQYLSELAEEIAASKRPHAQYGVLMVVGLGKACLAFSNFVARALKNLREAGPKGQGGKEAGGAGPGGTGSIRKWRAQLIEMTRELSLLRRRVLHELLPLAEAREAAPGGAVGGRGGG